jgi:hypothetical protein
VVRQGRIAGHLQTGAAGTFVIRDAETHRVSTVVTNKPPVLVGDHRAEIDSLDAMRAADSQDCVGLYWAAPHLSKGSGT